jgi:hypothetical protein
MSAESSTAVFFPVSFHQCEVACVSDDTSRRLCAIGAAQVPAYSIAFAFDDGDQPRPVAVIVTGNHAARLDHHPAVPEFAVLGRDRLVREVDPPEQRSVTSFAAVVSTPAASRAATDRCEGRTGRGGRC